MSKGLPSSRSLLVRPRRVRPGARGERGCPRLRTRRNMASAKLPHGDAVLGFDLPATQAPASKVQTFKIDIRDIKVRIWGRLDSEFCDQLKEKVARQESVRTFTEHHPPCHDELHSFQ